jgi:pimeloyl-ACP methyl ester carboxylesterase
MTSRQDPQSIGRRRRVSASRPRISYLDLPADGEADGATPILLLHGVGSSSATWHELLPRLDGRRVIAPDYRGHGASEAPPLPYVMDDFVTDAFRLLDELSVDAVHVAGFSIGALFAERLALIAPERVRSLVLLNSIAARTPEQQARAAARLALIAATPPAELAWKSAERWFTPDFIAANRPLVEREVAIVSAITHAPYAASYRVLVENDLIDAVPAIGCPTLVITGERDEGSTPAMSEALHRRIAGSRMVIVPGVKHYIHIEQPAALAEEINRFLAAVDPKTRTRQPTAAGRL